MEKGEISYVQKPYERQKERSSMSESKRTEVLSHPSLGKLPARKVLDCIYALSPDGPYLHHHLEEVNKTEDASGIVYTPERPASSCRARALSDYSSDGKRVR